MKLCKSNDKNSLRNFKNNCNVIIDFTKQSFVVLKGVTCLFKAFSPVCPKGANISGGHCISDLVELKRQLHNTVRTFQWVSQTFHSNITNTCCSLRFQCLQCLFILILQQAAIQRRNHCKHQSLLSDQKQKTTDINPNSEIYIKYQENIQI